MPRLASHTIAMLVTLASATVHGTTYVWLPGGDSDSVLPRNMPGQSQQVHIGPFELHSAPVTIDESQTFVQRHEAWQRGYVPQVFTGKAYLADQADATHTDVQASPQALVTDMSWFAARAYCEDEDARLPTWLEWESATATGATHADARDDPQWARRIFGWYEQPVTRMLPPMGGPADVHGMYDMYGLVWEQIDDFNTLFIAGNSRTQGDPDKQKFCDAGAISIVHHGNYAMLMCVALLSSLEGADATGSLGFRCTRSLDGDHP